MLSGNRKLLFRSWLKNQNVSNKFYAMQIATSSLSIASDEWNRAKPISKMPGPSRMKAIFDLSPLSDKSGLQFNKLFEKYRESYGDIFRMPGLLNQPDTVIICNADHFEHVFRKEGPWPTRGGMEIMEYYRRKRRPDIFRANGGLLIEHGQRWSEFRTAVNPVMMQPKIVRLYVSPIDEIADEFVARMKKIRDPKSLELPVNFEEEMNGWSLEAITLIALDTRLGLTGNLDKNTETKQYIDAVKRFFHLVAKFIMKPPVWKIYQSADFKELMKVLDVITDTSKSFVDAAKKRIEFAKNDNKNSPREESVLEKLIKVDPYIATIMAIDMIMAGVDTTSSGFVATLYNLSVNSDKQEILRREILGILPTKDSKLTPEKIKNLPYLRACIKEAMRIFPVASGNTRDTTQDMVLANYQIPKGTRMMMLSEIPQRNESIFKDANKFIPERWLRSSDSRACPTEKGTNAFAFLPFGFGPRMCIGKRFAELEMEVLLSRVIRNFRVEWHKPELKFKSGGINVPADPLQFKVIDINDQILT